MGNGFDLAFAEELPCHLTLSDQETETAWCEACDLAVEAWSQEFVGIKNDLVSLCIASEGTIIFSDIFSQEQYVLMEISDPDPPDKFAILHSHLIFQRGIVLVI